MRGFHMKHRKKILLPALLALVLAAAMLLLSGCSSAVYVTVNARWQSGTAFDTDFSETLTYSVSFESAYDEEEAGWYIDIDGANSSYTVTTESLSAYQFPVGELHLNVYHIRTELILSATYSFRYEKGGELTEIVSFGGDSGTEPDHIVTDVWFHSLTQVDGESQHALEPIYSTRTVYSSHTASGYASDDILWYNYSSAIKYNHAATSAELSFTDGWGELSEEERQVSDSVYKYSYSGEGRNGEMTGLRDSYSAFDNEQLYFVARGLTYSASSAETVNVITESAGAQNLSVSCSERANTRGSFLLSSTDASAGTTTVSQVNADIFAATVSFSLANAGNAQGAARTVVFAQERGYYNVPLRMEMPYAYSVVGTSIYTLTSFERTE